LGLVSSAARHRAFFEGALGALAEDGGYRRVLVSGAAGALGARYMPHADGNMPLV
jgi:hypothetical protein